jgi:hypothetical protein
VNGHAIALEGGVASAAAMAATTLARTPHSTARAGVARSTVSTSIRRDTGSFAERIEAGADAAERLPVVLVRGLVLSSRYMTPLAAVLDPRCSSLCAGSAGLRRSRTVSRSHRERAHALSIPERSDALHDWLLAHEGRFAGVDTRRHPRDFATFARFGRALAGRWPQQAPLASARFEALLREYGAAWGVSCADRTPIRRATSDESPR